MPIYYREKNLLIYGLTFILKQNDLGILEVDTIKQTEMKEKLRKEQENFLKPISAAEISLNE